MPFSEAFDPIRSFKAAWALLKQAPLSVLLGGLLPVLVQFVVVLALDVLLFLPLWMSPGFQRGMPEPGMILLLVGLIAFACSLVLLLPVLLMMTVFAVLLSTDLPALLKVAVGGGIGLLWLLGYLYVLLGLSLVTAIVSYENCGPAEAI